MASVSLMECLSAEEKIGLARKLCNKLGQSYLDGNACDKFFSDDIDNQGK